MKHDQRIFVSRLPELLDRLCPIVSGADERIKAANASWPKPRSGDGTGGVFPCCDLRYVQAYGAQIQNFQDVACIILPYAHDWSDVRGLGGPYQVSGCLARESCVLAVDDHMIKAAETEALDDFGRGDFDEAPEKETVFLEALFSADPMHDRLSLGRTDRSGRSGVFLGCVLFLGLEQIQRHIEDHVFLAPDHATPTQLDQDLARIDAVLFGSLLGVT